MADRCTGASPNPYCAAESRAAAALCTGLAAGLAFSRRTRTAGGTMLVRARSFCASGRFTTVLLPVMVALAFSLPAAAAAADAAADGCGGAETVDAGVAAAVA
eukprot:scaffold306769_cov18-Tisochrysis_lutea.AAC.1